MATKKVTKKKVTKKNTYPKIISSPRLVIRTAENNTWIIEEDIDVNSKERIVAITTPCRQETEITLKEYKALRTGLDKIFDIK